MSTLEKGIEKVFWRRRLSRISKRELTPIQTVRIVMFGLGGVGKTSLIHRFLFGKFDHTYTATVEDDYRQVITYNDHIVDVTILDTAGSYQFPAMRRHAIQNGQGFLLVYAVDNQQSLGEVSRLHAEILEVKGGYDKVPIIVVGNKLDKDEEGTRCVDRVQIQKLISELGRGVEHIETSAKLDENVSLVFNKMIWIIDETRSRKKGIGSVGFSTTYDQITNSNNPHRTLSLDFSTVPNLKDWGGMKNSIYGRCHSLNPINFNRGFSVMNENISYGSQLLPWHEPEEMSETSQIKKKQHFLKKIFTK